MGKFKTNYGLRKPKVCPSNVTSSNKNSGAEPNK